MDQFITTVITTSFVIFYKSGILKIKNGPWKHTYTLRAAPNGRKGEEEEADEERKKERERERTKTHLKF